MGKYDKKNAWHRGAGPGEYEYVDGDGYVSAEVYPNTKDRWVWSAAVTPQQSVTGIEDRLSDAKAKALEALKGA